MKKQLTSLIVAVMSISILTSCSNDEYENAIDKGIKSLGEKDYHQASIYFELALQEKEGSKEASTYFEQSKEMDNAVQAYKDQEFNSALRSLDIVLSRKNGLETIKTEAQNLKKQISSEKELISSIESEIKLIKSLIEKKSYDIAQEKLQQLEKEIEGNKKLSSYKSDVTKLTEEVELAINESEEDNKGKVEESKTEEKNDEKKMTYSRYTNDRFGFSLQYPSDLMMAPPPTNGDGAKFYNDEFELTAFGSHTNVINQGETIETYYQQDLNSIPGEIAYKKLTKNWYVLSYKENGRITYKKFFFGDTVANTFIITYPASTQDKFNAVTTHIAETFVPSAY